MNIEFKITNQILERTDSNKLVKLTKNYLKMVFNFETEEWNELIKFAIISINDEATKIALENDELTIPSELLTSEKLTLSIYGIDEENTRITTNNINIYFLDTLYANDTDEPEWDTLETIYIALNNKANKNHSHNLTDIDLDTAEMTVTYADNSTETYNLVTKNDESNGS